VTARRIIFLDDGGVMNDNNVRALQWRRVVGEYFVPLLGGSPQAWSHANRVVTDRLLEPDAWRRRVQAAADYRSFERDYQVEWLRGMCELVGIETPPEDECLRLARRSAAFITRRVRAAFPGVVEKRGPEYYERIFADLGVAPSDTLVVDDSPRATRWATQMGARTVLVRDSSLPRTGSTVHIRSLIELPAMVQQLD
jgi:hypothetical protein